MFSFLDTKHKRKSAVLTSVLMSLLLIALFFVGLTYLDPPEEYGIAVNFGTSDVGMGTIQPTKPIKSSPEETLIKEVKKEIQKTSEPVTNEKVTEASEEVATQNNEEAIAIKKKQDAKREKEEIAKNAQLEKERIEREKQAAIKEQKAIEEAKRKKLDALIGGINNANGTMNGGEGNDNKAGDKGNINGDPNANGYYGNGNGGGGEKGDYHLGKRKPMNRPKPNYICNEEGLVVVRIEVDVNGKVIKATPGVKGTTTITSCSLTQAKEAALKTKWTSDNKAPSKQIGYIKYKFSYKEEGKN